MVDRLGSSFRDPSGFIYRRSGTLLRQVNVSYAAHFDALIASGLYDELVGERLLVEHGERNIDEAATSDAYRVIEPAPIAFVSYPYEWCFGQLKEAALTTLEIQRRAMRRQLSLKDASAFNIQFRDGQPIFIDTLSFEPYVEGAPWVAYRQFCQHFLAPLLLMSFVDARLVSLLERHLDGIPLDLTSTLLPGSSWLRPSTALHIHAHARALRRYARPRTDGSTATRRVGRSGVEGLISNLDAAVRRLDWTVPPTEWGDYRGEASYSEAGWGHKIRLVTAFLTRVSPTTVWDLGANTGTFSRQAADSGASVVAIDGDRSAVQRNYESSKALRRGSILPLCIDLTNPSPAIGWANGERMSLAERGPADLVMALALVHHLAIAHNVPLPAIAHFLARLAPHLIIEFVPKSDPQTQRLLASRVDIFADYHREAFEHAFETHYEILAVERVTDSDRELYLMQRRSA